MASVDDVAEETVTLAAVEAAMDNAWARMQDILSRFAAAVDAPPLAAGPDEGGWDARHVLSHLVGAWQRVPVHAGYYLAGAKAVPLLVGDSYWIPEWEDAPLESFAQAMRAAYEGTRAWLHRLDPATLALVASTPFGDLSLGELLLTSYCNHIDQFHGPQLEAFLQVK